MTRLPAEWEPQAFIQFTFPHKNSDWAESFDEVVPCFVEIIKAVAQFQNALVICDDITTTKAYFDSHQNIFFTHAPSNDTWARDHSAITVVRDQDSVLLDFFFNGWGLKFPADKDNLITQRLYQGGIYGNAQHEIVGLALEGGAIESDGQGTVLTTSECLLSPNRNPHLSKKDMEEQLQAVLGIERMLWLDHGYLAGDDTDSHIDTLARFCNLDTICYVQCDDDKDEHFEALQFMESQLQTFVQKDGNPYKLVALPLPDACYDQEGNRLPATYANFLILNGAVLVPTYQQAKDKIALEILRGIFPEREVIGINCLPLIEQHGSLHCITMQFPESVKLSL